MCLLRYGYLLLSIVYYYYGDDFSVGMNLLGGEGVMNFGYDLLINKSGQKTQVSFAFSNKNIIDWP